MEPRELLDALCIAQRLKDTMRHCYTEKGRHESVAEHCFMMTLMAFYLRDVFPDTDMGKVMEMCVIHDLGEAFTGDIPAFVKTDAHEAEESALRDDWIASLPEPVCTRMSSLYAEMDALETPEAKLYKALDGLEAVIAHNHSDLSTWLALEYELNRTYADDKVAFSSYLTALRAEVRLDTEEKLRKT